MAFKNLSFFDRRGRFARYAPLLVWIGVIFFLSSTAGSMSNTSRFVRPLLMFLFPDASEESLLVYHTYVRKLAHVTEYGILGFWAARAFYYSSTSALRRFAYALAFAVVAVVAVADEFNQSFLKSRTSSPFDVLLDCFGGAVGVALFVVFAHLFAKRGASRKNDAPGG